MTMVGTDKARGRAAASVTIADVAAQAGVSIKTVSRVLNDEPNVRQDKRDRVMAAVEALSYRPNAWARSLAAGRSFLIGLFYENPNVHYIANMQHGALTRCSRLGYHLVVEECEGGSPLAGRRVGEIARQTRLDGAILSPPVSDNLDILEALEDEGIPVVRIAPFVQPERTPRIWIDDRQAAYELTRHLIGLGHRTIGFIQGPPDHGASHWREEGFRDAMAEAGLTVRPHLLRRGDFSYALAGAATEEMLAAPERPTAVFASNDDMAAGVLAVAYKRGLSVPGDLSVVGFDDTPMASCLWPRLTTVYQPIADLAAHAVDLLIEARTQGLEPADRSVRLDYRLVLRESTGPVAGGRQ